MTDRKTGEIARIGIYKCFCIYCRREIMRPTFIGQLATPRQPESELFVAPSRSLVSLFQFGPDCSRPFLPSIPNVSARFHPVPASFASSLFLAPRERFIKPTRNFPLLIPERKKDRLALILNTSGVAAV